MSKNLQYDINALRLILDKVGEKGCVYIGKDGKPEIRNEEQRHEDYDRLVAVLTAEAIRRGNYSSSL